MNGKQFTVSAMLVAILSVFAIYVWPTRYIYIHFGQEHIPVRIDRFTGEAEWLMPGPGRGWEKMKMEPLNMVDELHKTRPMPTTPELPPGFVDPFEKSTPTPKH